jgi:hypothetical protein
MKNYIMNMETTKIELYFDKEEYDALSEDQHRALKGAFLWSRAKKAWVSRAKEPNLWRAKAVAKELGFENEERHGERLSYAEQLERKAERAEARAERMEIHAENAEKRAEQLQGEFDKYRQDWSWLTQPVIPGHSGSQRFARQRQKIMDRYEKGFEEYRKSEYFRERADAARATASMSKLRDPIYLEKQIGACESEIRKIKKNMGNYEGMLQILESGTDIRKFGGGNWSIEEINENLARLVERLEVCMDKQGFFENCMDEIGGIQFSSKNLKKGYIVELRRWGNAEVVKCNPKSVDIKTERGSILRTSYGDIVSIVKAEEKQDDAQHPFKVGEILAWYDIYGKNIIRAYKITKVTAKTIKMIRLTVEDGKVLEDKPVGAEILKKPSIRPATGEWTVYEGDWPMRKMNHAG